MSSEKRDRSVAEIYNATELIGGNQIAQVSQGSFLMQGPVDEKDHSTQTNMVSPQVEKRYGKRSMNRRGRMIAESGTCNVCSAPCSSCMHLNRAHTGPKTEEVSDSHYSVNAGDVKGRACESIQHTASEASNILSINSTHDSLSENAESKAIVRSSNIPDPLEDIKPHLKFTSGKIGAVDQLPPETEHILEQGKTSSEFVDSQGMEGHDDNISCVSRASGGNAVVSSSTRDVENKIDSLENGSKGVDADGSSPVIDSSKGHSECGGHLIGGSSEDSMKAEPNSEAEVDKDGGKSPDEVMKGSDQAEKSSELAELPDMQDPPSRAESETESDESNILEHDVKVCDICGDVGREDLLATCSRCSDGAEHTYCMKEMIQKVPEGDWLCEECKFAEESESQRQGSDAEEKRASKGSSSTQNSGKRRAESLEVASSAKRQAIEASFGSLKSPSTTRAAALSRESSFKSLDKGKMRLTHSGNQSGSDTPESGRSSTMSPRLKTLKSTLTKSNSFSTSSSKPKVKLVDEVRPQKLRGTKELSLKEPPTKVVGKSTSFKSPNSLNSSESKSKILPSKSSHVQDLKGWKHMKDRNSFERKPLPKLDRSLTCSAMGTSTVSTPRTSQKLTPRGETNSLFHTSNRRESKVWRSDGKPSTLTKSNSNSRKGVEHPVSSVGASSGNGIRSSSEEKLSQVNTKDEHLTMPKTAALCQKCKEVGRAVENCSLCSLQTSGIDVAASRTSRNEINKTNDLKAAIEAAIQKVPRKFAKNKAPDKSDGFAVPTLDVNCEKASQNQPFSNKMKTAVSGEGTYEGKLSLQRRASDFHIQPMINNAKQLNDHAIDSFGLQDSDRVVSSAGKPMMEDWPMVSSVIPEHEYIWQGAFEVDRAGKHDLCGGIQAHLSTGASPKVLEVVNKFSYKMQLMEVPRLSSWPTHFQSCGAKEDNIALYFFAKDIESYEKTYKVLVDNMIKSDLALIANFEGVELLIFPSNLLPEDCQRWNMLYFLWGVFKARKVVGSNLLKSPMAQFVNKELFLHNDSNTAVISNIPNKTPVILNRDCGNKVSLLKQTTIVLQENSENDDSVPSTKLLSNIEPGNDKIRSEARCTTPSLEEDALPESETRTDVKPFLEATGTNIGYDRADKRNTPVSVSVGESVKEILSDRTNGDRSQLKDKSVKVEDEFTDTGTVAECKKELNPLQPSRQKRPHSDLDETATRTSPVFTPKIPLDDLNCVFVDDDDDSVSKKLKTGCSSGDANFVAPVKDVGCSSFVDFKLQDKARDEEVIIIPEDTETGEGYLYPVKSGRVDDFQSGDNLKRQDRESRIPNLNLAFGDETDPPELVLSDKSMDEKDLSLSLSFPFPDKEQNPKPVSETEPKSWPGDTSVFLFGNILKK